MPAPKNLTKYILDGYYSISVFTRGCEANNTIFDADIAYDIADLWLNISAETLP